MAQRRGAGWATPSPGAATRPTRRTASDGAGVAFTLGSMPVSWQLVGAVLFGIAALIAYWQLARRDDPEGLLFGALVLAVAFFALPTRVHERYMFPALALAAPLVLRRWPTSRGWLIAAVAGAAALVLLLDVLPRGRPAAPGHDDADHADPAARGPDGHAPRPGPMGRRGALRAVVALGFRQHLLGLHRRLVLRGRPAHQPGRRRPADAARSAAGDDPLQRHRDRGPVGHDRGRPGDARRLGGGRWPGPRSCGAPPTAESGPRARRRSRSRGRGVAATAPAPRPARIADGRSSSPRPWPPWPATRSAASWPGCSPTRAIRTCASAAAGWTASTWPWWSGWCCSPSSSGCGAWTRRARMHFDEVYHARSATEWLADWQEGWTRDTYEWTHPMLAKYLIAAGIVVADPNKVVAETDTGAPYHALAVAPQRQAEGVVDSIVFGAADGGTITARSVMSGEVVADVAGRRPGRQPGLRPGPGAPAGGDERFRHGDHLRPGRLPVGAVASAGRPPQALSDRDRPGGRERDRRAAGPARPPVPRPGRDRGDGEGHRRGAGPQ